jgi:hypothetical protein
LFETYFYKYAQETDFNRKYINVTWTNLYCNARFKSIQFNEQKLQSELSSLSNNKYFTVVQFDEGVLEKLPKNTLVFGCCSGDIPIPLTYESKYLDNIKKKEWKDKHIFCSFLGKHTHDVRHKLHNYITRQNKDDYVYHLVTGSYDKNMYIEKTIDSKFCLCPRGFGRSSFRFFEVLKLGSIPVYIWDDINWLPFQDKIDYSKLCVVLNVSDIELLDNKLRNITETQYVDMVLYYEKIKNYFTYNGMCEEIKSIVNKKENKFQFNMFGFDNFNKQTIHYYIIHNNDQKRRTGMEKLLRDNSLCAIKIINKSFIMKV